mgnify:CR=1 FL=1
MTKSSRKKPNTIPVNLIAPCGINCRLCWGYLREKNVCPGCLTDDSTESKKAKSRTTCRIKTCSQRTKSSKYCSDKCARFPCQPLKRLDKRYRTRYGASMIDNLKVIDKAGVRHFIQNEKIEWTCPECGDLMCIHKPACVSCGRKRQ